MRHNKDARIIKVDKAKLIAQIEANREKHAKEYAEAVEAFKKEADDQLKRARRALNTGEWKDVDLNLTVPDNRTEEYNKIIEMFTWELENEVELSQGEFNEYVLDELPFAVQSRFSNTMYLQKWSK